MAEDTATSGSVVLELEAIHKQFGGLTAVDAVSLQLSRGEVRGIIGPNGAGKTTLFNLITGHTRITSGTIRFAGDNVTGMKPEQISSLGIARTFQLTSIFPNLSALENVWISVNSRHGGLNPFRRWARIRDIEKEAQEVLASVGLGERGEVRANQLSYGQQRMLDIAMALAMRPRVLLLDEPTAGLGVRETGNMVRLVRSLIGEVTILLIEHDMDVITEIAEKITVLYNGAILAEGSPEAIAKDETVQNVYLGHAPVLKSQRDTVTGHA